MSPRSASTKALMSTFILNQLAALPGSILQAAGPGAALRSQIAAMSATDETSS
jgi:ABC-type transporter Mla maintaining outer membrane lipid asymmetry permease subunit MlaE